MRDQCLVQKVIRIKSRNRMAGEGWLVMCGCPLDFLMGADATMNAGRSPLLLYSNLHLNRV